VNGLNEWKAEYDHLKTNKLPLKINYGGRKEEGRGVLRKGKRLGRQAMRPTCGSES
jgi:hypothetical protein